MKRPPAILAALLLAVVALHAAAAKPSIIFIIADDASLHFGMAYGCTWVKTPNIDQLAKRGLVFANAYPPTAKCTPSRAAILTGRNPWQLEAAANPWLTITLPNQTAAATNSVVAVDFTGVLKCGESLILNCSSHQNCQYETTPSHCPPCWRDDARANHQPSAGR